MRLEEGGAARKVWATYGTVVHEWSVVSLLTQQEYARTSDGDGEHRVVVGLLRVVHVSPHDSPFWIEVDDGCLRIDHLACTCVGGGGGGCVGGGGCGEMSGEIRGVVVVWRRGGYER